MKISIILILCFLSSNAIAQTQDEMNQEAQEVYELADKKLNETYTEILQLYQDDTLFIKQLKITQRIWITYRDASLKMKYPAIDKRLEYGSVYPMCVSYYLAEFTNKRTSELNEWLQDTIEGEVCTGSVRRK